MVDHAAKLLEASPEFAALDESVRGQLLDAVKVAAATAGAARSDAGIDRLVSSSSDETLPTAEDLTGGTADLVEGAIDLVENVPADEVEADSDDHTGDDSDDEGPVDDAPVDDASLADEGNAAAPEPSTAEVRAWAGEHGYPVSDRGRLRAEVWEAYTDAHPEG